LIEDLREYNILKSSIGPVGPVETGPMLRQMQASGELGLSVSSDPLIALTLQVALIRPRDSIL